MTDVTELRVALTVEDFGRVSGTIRLAIKVADSQDMAARLVSAGAGRSRRRSGCRGA